MSMKPREMLLCALAVSLTAIAGPANGQDGDVVAQRTTVRSGGGTTVRKMSQVMKSKVIIQDDEPAGQVVDFVISDGGCIDYVVASYEDEYYVIPYSASVVRYDQNVVFVDISPSQFRNVQFFAANDWPDFYAADFRRNVFSTFGVNSFRGDADVDVDGRGRGRRDRDRDDDLGDRARDRADDVRNRRENARDRGEDRRDDARDREDGARDRADDARDRAKDRADEARDRAKDRAADRDRSATGERKSQKPPIPKSGDNRPAPPKNTLPNPPTPKPTPKKPAPKSPQSN